MTVKELIAELSKHPENMDVFMAERKTEFAFGLLNSVKKQIVRFSENDEEDEDSDSPEAFADCVILDEE